MIAAGRHPTASTYNTLLAAYAKEGNVKGKPEKVTCV